MISGVLISELGSSFRLSRSMYLGPIITEPRCKYSGYFEFSCSLHVFRYLKESIPN